MYPRPPQRYEDAVLGAVILVAVGALVGLFNQLLTNAESSRRFDVDEDYGLSQARLINTTIISGLAAVGGVLLVGFLPSIAEGFANGFNAAMPPDPGNIFNLSSNPVALLVAAVFGLSPRLFRTALNEQVMRIKSDLITSQVHDIGDQTEKEESK